MRVQHRHIIYIQGYDPRGLAQYYRMFRTELRKFGRLYQLSATVSRPKVASDDEIASWTIETKARRLADADRLRLPALRGFHPERPRRADLAHGFPRGVDLLAAGVPGTIARFARANWRFATFITYPHIVLLLEALCARCHRLRVRNRPRCARRAQARSASPLPPRVFVALLGTDAEIHREQHLRALSAVRHDLDLGILAPRSAPNGTQRIDRFAQHLIEVTKTSDAEEIVIVGHSSGSFLGTEMLARALKLDPDLGRHGPRVVLLTLGGNFPIVGFHKVVDRSSASICGSSRSSRRSTGSTARPART